MRENTIGEKGDFITSPEISQVFGEVSHLFDSLSYITAFNILVQLVGVWILADYVCHGKSSPWQLVEFGPGRGTLIADILRVCLHMLAR